MPTPSWRVRRCSRASSPARAAPPISASSASRWNAIVGEPLEREAFACVLPRNEPEFKRLVDDTIARLMASGELERIHERWFMRPLGTGGHALGLPISAELRALMAAPNDLPLQ